MEAVQKKSERKVIMLSQVSIFHILTGGRVTLNGKVAKPGAEVKPVDEMVIRFGDRYGRYEILSVVEHVRKEGATEMYRVLSEDAEVARERN